MLRFDVTLQLNPMLIRKGDAKYCERELELIERTMKDCGWSEDNPLFAAVVSGLKESKFKDNKDEWIIDFVDRMFVLFFVRIKTDGFKVKMHLEMLRSVRFS